ncbi:MAG: signal peptidase II [Oscillospiraceae bacterium]
MKKTLTEEQRLNITLIISLLGAAVLVGIDQLTKWLIVQNFELHESLHLIKFGEQQVLNFTYYLNDGAAFSMFGGKTAMLICVTSLMMGAMLCAMVLKHVRRLPYIISFSLVIAGGVGNLIDRIMNDGRVVDFIDVRIINFAVFNFADICAVCGGILLCLLVVLDEIKENRAKKSADTAETVGEASDSATEDISESVNDKTPEETSDDTSDEAAEDGND